MSFGFSAWLTYAELVLIDAVCAWCVTSAILVTLALVITVMRAASPAPTQGGSARRSAPDPRSPEQTPRIEHMTTAGSGADTWKKSRQPGSDSTTK